MRPIPIVVSFLLVVPGSACYASYEDVPCYFEAIPEPLGDKVDLVSTPYCEFPSDEPFYIAHGWWQWPACFEGRSEEWISAYVKQNVLFELTVNGNPVDCDFISVMWEMNDDPTIAQECWRVQWYYCFDAWDFSRGIHMFEGTWMAPYPELAECRTDEHPEQPLGGIQLTTIAILHP